MNTRSAVAMLLATSLMGTFSIAAAAADRQPATEALAGSTDAGAAHRGLIAQIPDGVIRDADGGIVWDWRKFSFLDAKTVPDGVDAALWAQARRNAEHGLFEVVPGAVWQVRGYDIAVMTVIRGQTGWIVVDPLTVTETAKAAFELVQQTLGERPVSAILFTHSHGDHFGGVFGVVSRQEIERRNLPIYAPQDFVEKTWRENLLAGPVMQVRAAYMFGTNLTPGPDGFVDNGIGAQLPRGNTGFAKPTNLVSEKGGRLLIDGVEFDFMDASGTEAPAEFVFFLPQWKAVHTAEIATQTQHNVLTPRGAKVRDALLWSQVLDDLYQRCEALCEVRMASHGWPSFGQDNVLASLAQQRDTYRYIHDQTLGAANRGLPPDDIAAAIAANKSINSQLIPGYYGDLKHNVRAVYQGYFGWWDGNPAHLDRLPSRELARHYVELGGGVPTMVQQARKALSKHQYRWAMEILNHLMFSENDSKDVRELLATAYESYGKLQTSNAVRNYHLSAAREIRTGRALPPISGGVPSSESLNSIPLTGYLDVLATRYKPQEASAKDIRIVINSEDSKESAELESRPLAEIVRNYSGGSVHDIKISGNKLDLIAYLSRDFEDTRKPVPDGIRIEGDKAILQTWLSRHHAPPTRDFPLASPE